MQPTTTTTIRTAATTEAITALTLDSDPKAREELIERVGLRKQTYYTSLQVTLCQFLKSTDASFEKLQKEERAFVNYFNEKYANEFMFFVGQVKAIFSRVVRGRTDLVADMPTTKDEQEAVAKITSLHANTTPLFPHHATVQLAQVMYTRTVKEMNSFLTIFNGDGNIIRVEYAAYVIKHIASRLPVSEEDEKAKKMGSRVLAITILNYIGKFPIVPALQAIINPNTLVNPIIQTQ